MNPKPISEANDPDARNALAALRRAALNAHKLAERYNTPLVIRPRETPRLGDEPRNDPINKG